MPKNILKALESTITKKCITLFVLFVVSPFFNAISSSAAPTDGLVVHLDFEADQFSQGLFRDKSSMGNNADCQKNFELSCTKFPQHPACASSSGLRSTTHDQCPVAAPGIGGGTSAQFRGTLCDMGSDYLHISRSASLNELPNGTAALWVMYECFERDAGGDCISYPTTRLLDAFSSDTALTWGLGRDKSSWNILRLNDQTGSEFDILSFPDAKIGYGRWAHVAITWGNGKIRGYYNGTLFSEITSTRFPRFALGDYLAVNALMHHVPRNSPDFNCPNQYNAPKDQLYVQPNAGFLNGRVDDIRIYNRALSASEILSLTGMGTPASTRVLVIDKTGDGLGFVGSDPARMECGRHCAESFEVGKVVRLKASPAANSVFIGWSEPACGNKLECPVTLSNHKKLEAQFRRKTQIGPRLEAESGDFSPGIGSAIRFQVENGSISQIQRASSPLTPSKGARAEYKFELTESGSYYVVANVNAPSSAADSFYLNIDAEPTEITHTPPAAGDFSMAWHIYSTLGFEEKIVSWQGTGQPDDSKTWISPQTFSLSRGPHTLILRGREVGAQIDYIQLEKIDEREVPKQPSNLQIRK